MEQNKAYNTPEPNFARFDNLSKEQREQAIQMGEKDFRHQRRCRWFLCSLILFAILALASCIFLKWPRLDGYVNIAPLTVVSVQGERATFQIDNAQTAELLGQNIITVPYLLEGMAPADLWRHSSRSLLIGETEQACQLVVKLNNFDLLRLGINPFRHFTKQDHMGKNDWIVSILRAAFSGGASDDVLLELRYFVPKEPLLWYAE